MATALVVIDVQQALIDELEPERAREFLATLRGLIERARAVGTPVVYVRHDGRPNELIPGTRGWEIVREIAPQPGEAIVDKRFFDAFRDTSLAEVFARLDADRLVLSGMQTEFCVDATLREAERRGYRVTLVADGHATCPAGGLSEEQIRNHVHRIARELVDIAPAAELFAPPVPAR